MKIGNQEIIVVALLVVVGSVVLCGFFLTKSADKPVQPVSPILGESFVPGESLVPGGEPSGSPRLELSSAEVSFGTIDPYTPRTSDVVVKNVGDAVLKISGVKSSCQCTQARVENDNVAPGRQTILHVEMNPQRYHADSPRIQVLIVSNDPLNRAAILRVSADIEPEFVIEPMELDFGHMSVGEKQVLTVHARQELDEEFKILRVTKSLAGIDTRFKEVTAPDDRGRRSFEIEVTVMPGAKPGALDGNLVVWTNIKRIPYVYIPVKGQIIGVEAVPATVHFGLVEPGRGEVARLILRGPYPFEIVETHIEIDGLSLEVDDDESRMMKQTVRIVMDEGAEPGSRHGTANVTVLANGKREFVEVPVHGLVREPMGDG